MYNRKHIMYIHVSIHKTYITRYVDHRRDDNGNLSKHKCACS